MVTTLGTQGRRSYQKPKEVPQERKEGRAHAARWRGGSTRSLPSTGKQILSQFSMMTPRETIPLRPTRTVTEDDSRTIAQFAEQGANHTTQGSRAYVLGHSSRACLRRGGEEWARGAPGPPGGEHSAAPALVKWCGPEQGYGYG